MTDDISSGCSEPQHIPIEGTERRGEVQNFRQIATLDVTEVTVLHLSLHKGWILLEDITTLFRMPELV